jgi:hypothetical protein
LQEFSKITTLRKREDILGASAKRKVAQHEGQTTEECLKTNRYVPLLLVLLLLLWGGDAQGAVIRDLVDLSQDPLAYVDRSAAEIPLVPAKDQGRLAAEYEALFFAPWHQMAPRHTPEQVSWGFREYGPHPGYGKNGRRHPADWVPKMAANAHLDDYPQGGFPAVTVTRADFRVLPTSEPHSKQPKNPGKDYPFDNLQESSVPAGAPVLVIHVSRDRKWLLAETAYALGWVPAGNVAAVGPDFMKTWESGRYAAIIRDKAPVTDGKRVLFRAPLGAIFPKTGEDAKRTWILSAVRGRDGQAHLLRASLAKAAAADWPLALTPIQMAKLARELAGEPYGWGGMGGKRDCSALTRDLFAPFGLWLPRNSGEQAGAGTFISLKNLPAADKEALIIQHGIPWRTLLWRPGHIMLYIGIHQGKPLIFHNFWSIKTRDAQGGLGRIIVGRAAVTALHPGRELPNLDLPRADILHGLDGLVILGLPPVNGATTPGKAESRDSSRLFRQ